MKLLGFAAALLCSAAAFAQQADSSRDSDRRVYHRGDYSTSSGSRSDTQRAGAPDPYAPKVGAPDPYAPKVGAPDPYATRAGDPNPYATRAGDPNAGRIQPYSGGGSRGR